MITTKTITTPRLPDVRGYRTLTLADGQVFKYNFSPSSATIGADVKVMTMDSDWKVKVAKKLNATNPYTLREFNVVRNPVSIAISTGDYATAPPAVGFSRYEGTLFSPVPNEPFSNSSEVDLAVKRLKRKLSDDIGFFNAVIPVVELRELKSASESLVSSFNHLLKDFHITFKDRKKLPAKSLFAQSADAWLQWSFGIKPLINDVKSATDALNVYFTQKDHPYRVEAGAGSDYETSWRAAPLEGPYGWNQDLYYNGYHKRRVKLIGEFDLKVVSSNDYGAMGRFGLDWSSVPSTLYELTPYSWLIDYFTTLGDVINDEILVPPSAMRFLSQGARVESKYSTEFRLVRWPGSQFNRKIVYNRSTSGLSEAIAFQRTSLSSIPSRLLRFKTRHEVATNGVNKLLNVLSIEALFMESRRAQLKPEEAAAIRNRIRRG